MPVFTLAAPLLWGAFAFLAKTKPRWPFPTAIFVHYVSAISYVAWNFNDDFRDPYRNLLHILAFARPYLVVFSVVYLVGQGWLWFNYVTTHKELS